MRYVAEKSNLPFNTLTQSMTRVGVNVAKAVHGSGSAAKALNDLGLSAARLSKMTPEAKLEAVAEAMKGVTTQGERTRLAMELMGREGASMLQIMEDGAAGIRGMREEADQLGITLTAEDALKLVALDNQVVS